MQIRRYTILLSMMKMELLRRLFVVLPLFIYNEKYLYKNLHFF